MKSTPAALALAAGLTFGAISSSSAQTIVFSDDFDSYSSPSTVTAAGIANGYKILFGAASGPSDFSAVFGYDYSADGIPSAPDSVGGSTKGLRLTVNKDATAAVAALNLYPTNKSFSGNFSLKFDMWIKWVAGAGTTEHAMFGINHTGSLTNRVGATAGTGSDGLFFAVDGDGGSSTASTTLRDYSVFRGAGNAVPVLLLTNTAGFALGPTPPLGGRFSAGDVGFQGLFPASSPVGSAGNQWIQCEVRQETNVVTWLMNSTIVVQYTNTFAYGSGDILLGYEDAFSSIGDPGNCVIFDNISVTSLGGLPVATVTASPTVVTEGGSSAQFTITRSDASGSLTINYTMSGTASNGLDYTTLPGSVTLPAGVASTNIAFTALHDGISEPLETATLNLAAGTGYTVSSPAAATIAILDIDTPTISISNPQPILLEGVSAATVPMTLSRIGQTNTALTVNIGYSGGAVRGLNFNAPTSVSIPAGAISATFNMTPINDDIVQGMQTSIVSIATGSGYVAGSSPSVTTFIVDDDVLPGAVLFFDSFDTTNADINWVVNTSDGGIDTHADFGYDYSIDGIPEAPSTPAGATSRHGLKMHVNEFNTTIAGVSASPTNGDFEGNYRLRFDMWMIYAGPLDSGTVPGTTQTANAGVGTSGLEPVWVGGSAIEGVWFGATGDGGSAALAGDYNAYEGTTLLDDSSGVYAAGTTNGPRDNLNAYYAPWPAVIAPAAVVTAHPTETGSTGVGTFGLAWHKVAITKRSSVITWDIDGRRLATVDAGALSISLSTNVFVGYQDPFSSVTTNAAAQFGLFDNVRVETLGRPLLTTSAKAGNTVTINFTAEAGDAATDFAVQTAATVTGVYSPIAATINQIDATHFSATVNSPGGSAYFRVRRL